MEPLSPSHEPKGGNPAASAVNLTPSNASQTSTKMNSNSIYSLIERAKQKKIIMSPNNTGTGTAFEGSAATFSPDNGKSFSNQNQILSPGALDS